MKAFVIFGVAAIIVSAILTLNHLIPPRTNCEYVHGHIVCP